MKPKYLLYAAVSALLMQPRPAPASSAGNSTGQVLKLGGGARYAALGDTGGASGEDSSAVFWNPAGLAFSGGCSVSTNHSSLFQSVNYTSLSAACPAANLGVVALGGQFLSYGEMRSLDNTGTADGSFTPSERVISGAWARKLYGNIAVGATAKRLMLKIDDSAAAYAADAGILARFSVFSVGASVKNMHRKIKLNDVPESLPKTIKFGAMAELDRFSFSADVNSSRDGSWTSGGFEYVFSPALTGSPFALRAGYSNRPKTARYNFTVGAGVREKSWALDYALVPYGDLGLTHHFSISYAFAGQERAYKIKAEERGESLQDKPGPQPEDLILIPAEYRPAAAPKR